MHVVITGASSGIGEALAREYARAGASVTLVARRKELLDQLAAEIDPSGAKSYVAAVDLLVPERAADFLVGAIAKLGPVDVLVNNAGSQTVRLVEELGYDEGEAMVRLNLLSPMRILHAVLPDMRARRSGVIANVCSVASFTTMPGMGWYGASKSGLACVSETLRAELRGSGVHVLTVYPGPVDTAMGRAGYAALEPTVAASLTPTGTSDVLARRVRRAVEKRSARLVYPRVYWVPRWLPGISRFFTDRFSPRPRSLPATAAAAALPAPNTAPPPRLPP